MSLFIDASALVAMMADEPERDAMLTSVFAEEERLWSAMTCWEAVSALVSSYQKPLREARAMVDRSAELMSLRLIAVGQGELRAALDAYQTYGRHSGSKAKLNMGDCFAYGCAKTHRAKLLYKGNDFVHTDLA